MFTINNTSLLKPVVEYTVEDLYKNNGSYTINYDPTNDVDNGGKTFTGWTGSNGNIPSKTFSFTTSELGDKEYYANWTIEVSIDDFSWNYDASDIDTWTYDSTTKYVEFNSTKHSEYIEVIYSGDLRGQKNVKSKNESYKTVATLTIKDEYKDSVTIVGANTSTLEWKIFPKVINYSDFEWQDENTFTYTGSTIKVSLKDVPNYLTVQYSNNTGTDVNEYTAEVVSITLSDSSNCNYVINKDQDIEPFNWYITTIFDTSKLIWSAGDDTDILQDETNKLLFTTVFDNDYHYLTINDNIIPSAIEKVYSFEDDKGNTIVDEKTIKNAGTYTFSIKLMQNKVYGINEDTDISATLIINKAPVSPSWDYNSETKFIYIKGKTYAVGIVNEENVIDGINLLDIYTITYTNNEKEEANTDENPYYTATAIFTINAIYAGNFEIDPDFNYELQWKINPKEINVGDIYQWNYKENEPLLYNGKEQSVSLEFKEGLTDDIKAIVDDAKITINYEGNKATQIGNEYEAKVVSITAENKNYKITNIEAIQPLKWAIVPSTIKLEGLTWGEFDATYNGQTHNITISGDVLTNNPNYVPTITYTPVDENENPTGDEASINGIINAGKYKVSVVFNDANGNATLTHELADKIIEIKKAKPTITLTAKDNCGYEHNIESNVKGSINVTLNGISISENEHEKITIATSELSISEYYAANENGEQTKYNGYANSNQIGLPIKVNVTHNNPNYEQLSETIVNVSINAVAHNGNGTYYSTIEWSLSNISSGTTVYVIPNLGIDVPIRKNIIIASGVTLALPFEGTTYNGRQNGKDSSKWFDDNGTGTGTCVSNVVIEQNVKVEVNGTLAIGGILGHEWIQRSGHTSGNHASITMKDNSSIISSGNIYCYGFIYDSSSSSKPSVVSINSGKLYMPFVIYDYKGGKSTVGAYQAGHIVPFNIFDMPNIYSTVTVSSSAELWGMADLYTGALSIAGIINVDPQHNNTDTKIIGSSSALINLNSNAYATINYNGSYTTLKLFGGASFGSLSLTVSVAGITRTVETSEIYFPISYKYEIELDGNGTYTMNHKMKLLPGSEIYVKSGSSLDIGSSGEMIVYDEFPDKSTISPYPSYGEAKLIVDGNLNIDGSFGGTIYTNNRSNNSNSAAKINISSSASLSLSSLEGDGELDTSKAMGGFLTGGLEGAINAMSIVVESTKWTTYQQANGNILNVDGSLFETGNTYYSRYMNSECTWYKPGTATMTMDPTLGTINNSSINVNIDVNSGYTIASNIDTSYVPTSPNKLYEFGGWYLDASCQINATNKTIWGDTTLYAKWNKLSYSINYDLDNYMEGTEATGSASYQTTHYSFNADTQSIYLSTPTHSEGYNFAGWYYDNNFESKINETSLKDMLSLASYANNNRVVTLYGLWYSAPIEITYVNSNNDYDSYLSAYTKEIPANIAQVRQFILPDLDDKNTDKSYEYYFEGWYLDANYSQKITSFTNTTELTDSMIEELINSKGIKLYAKWTTKVKVNYSSLDNSDYSFSSVFIYKGELVNYEHHPEIDDKNNDTSYNMYFHGWYLNSELVNNFKLSLTQINAISENEITLVASWETKKTITLIEKNPAGTLNKTTTLHYIVGTIYSLTANTHSGYEFSGWEMVINGTTSHPVNNSTITISSNIVLTANYKRIITLTVDSDDRWTTFDYKIVVNGDTNNPLSGTIRLGSAKTHTIYEGDSYTITTTYQYWGSNKTAQYTDTDSGVAKGNDSTIKIMLSK